VLVCARSLFICSGPGMGREHMHCAHNTKLCVGCNAVRHALPVLPFSCRVSQRWDYAFFRRIDFNRRVK